MAKQPSSRKKNQTPPVDDRRPLLIVGIGASAGGLPAFTDFLSHTPANTGMAFVLLPHLDPTHDSVMKELLRHQTEMPVCEAIEGLKVEPNCVYILDPAHGLTIADGELHLAERVQPRSRWEVVDQFLRSLAQDAQERAVGIILSGTGQHGIVGLYEVKQAGGLVLAQTPESCAYPQMPQRAIEEGLVDLVLTPAEMPSALLNFADRSHLEDSLAPNKISPQTIDEILSVLRSRSRYDFRSHRKNMLVRRILRRMALRHLGSLEEYKQRLDEDPLEVESLIRDLLIGVTAFFRDPLAFDILQQQAMPGLVERSSISAPLRVWVPGCSTGEEAYTLVMLLLEAFSAAGKTPNFQVFATDVNEDALTIARQGIYSVNHLRDVSFPRLSQYFVKLEGDRYQINQYLRNAVVFASQNLIGDPPFSHLDLVSCRNLLIYLQPELQSKIIQMFHFALNGEGHLLLGPSETIGRRSDLFTVVSKKWRIFRRLPTTERQLVDIPVGYTSRRRREGFLNAADGLISDRARFSEITLKTLLADYAPASVLINQKCDVLQFYGPTSNFLELPAGEPSLNLFALLRRGLGAKVREVASQAWKEKQITADPNAQVLRDGRYYPCRVVARPMPPGVSDGLLLISFEERAVLALAESDLLVTTPVPEDQRLIAQLEYELKASREDQQHYLDDLKSTNEDLRVSNEEMMSINEELQSANEELETSKEELQSVNEELNTVNAQLQAKVEELEDSNDDIINLLESSDVATLFLDSEMHIKLFNPPMAKLMNLRRVDLDRPIADINSKVQSDEFAPDARQVLDRLGMVERLVTSNTTIDPRNFIRRMVPYRGKGDRSGGVVITFVDITERYQRDKLRDKRLKKVSDEMTRNRERLLLVLKATDATVWEMDKERHGELVTDGEHAILLDALSGNRETSWEQWVERIHPEERAGVVSSLQQALTSDNLSWEQDYRFMATDTYQWISDTAYISRDKAGVWRRITGAMIHINDRRMAAIVAHAGEAMMVFDVKGSVTEFNANAELMFGYSAAEIVGKPAVQLVAQEQQDAYRKVIVSDRPFKLLKQAMQRQQLLAQHKDGTVFPIEVKISYIATLGVVVCVVHDLSEAVQLQQKVGEIASWEQETIGRELHDNLGQRLTGLRMLAAHLRNQYPKTEVRQVNMLDDIVEQLREAANEITRISHGLAPITVAPDGLADALATLMERTESSGKVRCRFHAHPGIIVSDAGVAHQVYRIAQEALNNALKYADPQTITISLTRSGDRLELGVHDDGDGFDMDEIGKHGGHGLRIMRYRANTIGALLSVDSKPGDGTNITCTFPGSAFT